MARKGPSRWRAPKTQGRVPSKAGHHVDAEGAGQARPTTVLTLGLGQVQSPRHPHIGPHRPAPGEPRTKVPEPPATARPVRPPPWQQGEVRSEMRGKAFSAARGPCARLPRSRCYAGETTSVPRLGHHCHEVAGGGRGAAPAAGPPLRLGAAVCGGSRASVPGRALPLLLHRDVESHRCLGILDLGDTNAP